LKSTCRFDVFFSQKILNLEITKMKQKNKKI